MASKIKVDQIQTADGTGTIALQNQLSGMTSASMPTGSVLQVVQYVKTDATAFSGNQYQDHEIGMTVSITPSSTSSKILITGHVSVGHSVSSAGIAIGLYRGNTLIGAGDAAGSRRRNHVETDLRPYTLRALPINFLDSPSTTSSTTYKLKASSSSASTLYINVDGENNTGTNHISAVSVLTAMEIAG